ncbi:MAG: O-antigen ligase family protein [bacterium]
MTAFFPLFFVQFLQRKSLKKTWLRWLLFGGNIILTFSRAAWLSWILELMILGFISYRKQISFFAKKVLLPTIIIFAGIAWVAKDQVINRQFSNTGHIQLLKQGRTYFAQHWITGMGAGSIGPASHWIGGLNFNPENQYLQIAIEF